MAKFSDLPEDVIAKIWSFLPAKSVLMLKSVRKSWNVLVNALVKTPSFVADHLNNSRATSSSFILTTLLGNYSNRRKKQKLLTLHRDGDNVEVIDDPKIVNASLDRSPNRDTTIISHCDGMVCSVEAFGSAVKLWNPATGELRRLWWPCCGENIAAGFGYDPISRAYKLVVVSRHGSRIAATACTIGVEMWRQVETRAIQNLESFDPRTKSAVCCGGVSWWIGRFSFAEKLVCFDMNTEKFETVSAPTEVDHLEYRREWPVRVATLQELGLVWSGKLRLARWMESVALLYDARNKASLADVWVISKTSKSWIKRFTFAKPSDEVQNTRGLIFHDVLENKYTYICSGETINIVRLVPHVDYNFVALP